jgi:membrane complex biogenesis BtpA family protein
MFELPSPCLIGMIHLPPLPGSPRHQCSLSHIIEHALIDARVLTESGFDALIIENFGDAPFPAQNLEPATIAAMAIVASRVHTASPLPIGINALRNDAAAALGIAVAAEASFIRVNVHVGVAATDQGMIEGRADDTLRQRQRLNPDIGILADIHVKHAKPVSQPDLALAAEETAYRGMADGLIVTGPTTGRAADLDSVRVVKQTVPDRPVLVGSGANVETVADILKVADGVIVGTAIKPGGQATEPIDRQLARAFVEAARAAGGDG